MYPELYDEWNIETSPMMILMKDGKEVDRSDAAEAWEVPPVFESGLVHRPSNGQVNT